MASPQPEISPDPIVDVHNPEHMKIGTLVYTKAGLIALFAFLLWGDFCFSLMETVIPSILPLELNKLGAQPWAITLIFTSIPNLMNTIINPIASFRSDRLRTKWGRRIPFLAASSPFVVLFLILLGYSEPISRFIHQSLLGGKGSDLTVVLTVVIIFTVGFQFFNLFITSIYYYLFNDVVPRAFLARMMALFRMVGTGAGAFYSYFIFQYSDTHMPEIFLGAALLYLLAFALMCWRVKEGNYPPPPENLGNEQGFIASIKTYAAECFTHRFYWLLFLANASWAMTWVTGPFNNIYQTQVLGFDRAFIGHVGGIAAVVSLVLLFPAGLLADRFHPLRINLLGIACGLVLAPLGVIFPFVRAGLSLHTAHMVQIALSAINLPINTLASAGEVALFMRLLPQERYGQFSSANALIRSIALIFGGFACGAFFGYVQRFGTVPNSCYRFLPLWNMTFQAGYVFFMYLLYREWLKLGGLKGYVPPSAKPPKEVVSALQG